MNILDELNAKVTALHHDVQELKTLLQGAVPKPVPHERIGIREAAKILNRSVDTVRDGCKSGRYPHHKDGIHFMFFRDELAAYMNQQPTTAASLAKKAQQGSR